MGHHLLKAKGRPFCGAIDACPLDAKTGWILGLYQYSRVLHAMYNSIKYIITINNIHIIFMGLTIIHGLTIIINNNIYIQYIYIYMQYRSIYYIHDYATIMPVCIYIYTCNVHRKKHGF